MENSCLIGCFDSWERFLFFVDSFHFFLTHFSRVCNGVQPHTAAVDYSKNSKVCIDYIRQNMQKQPHQLVKT